MTTSAAERFRELAESKLRGRKIDVVGFVDRMLELVREAGQVHCGMEEESALRVAIGGEALTLELDAARGKLRMMCARLSVLCEEAANRADFPYGGEGTIRVPNYPADRWGLTFINTPEKQEFAITHSSAHRPVVRRHGE